MKDKVGFGRISLACCATCDYHNIISNSKGEILDIRCLRNEFSISTRIHDIFTHDCNNYDGNGWDIESFYSAISFIMDNFPKTMSQK